MLPASTMCRNRLKSARSKRMPGTAPEFTPPSNLTKAGYAKSSL
jgi:hypothetical protein